MAEDGGSKLGRGQPWRRRRRKKKMVLLA